MKQLGINGLRWLLAIFLVVAATMMIAEPARATSPGIYGVYTLDADFDQGTLVGLNHDVYHDRLQLNDGVDTGTWTIVHDSLIPNAPWGCMYWNFWDPSGYPYSLVVVTIASSDDGVNFSTPVVPSVSIYLGASYLNVPPGRYLKVIVTLHRAGNGQSPFFADLTLGVATVSTISMDYRYGEVSFENGGYGNFGTVLPRDDDGNYVLQAVVKKDGVVASYNPGQYYSVSTFEIRYDIPEIGFFQKFPSDTEEPNPISALNPAMGQGGGSVAVVVVGADGRVRQVLDAKSPNVTILDNLPEDGVPDGAQIDALGPLAAGEKVMMYVKFKPGLKGKPFVAVEGGTKVTGNVGPLGVGYAMADIELVEK